MILHILNQSPYNNQSLEQCLQLCSAGDSLIFIEDAVYACNYLSADRLAQLSAQGNKLYLLKADVEARAINPQCPQFEIVDDSGFVDLTISHNCSQSWF